MLDLAIVIQLTWDTILTFPIPKFQIKNGILKNINFKNSRNFKQQIFNYEKSY